MDESACELKDQTGLGLPRGRREVQVPTDAKRDILLVLGMHRSGTSAAAGVFTKLGGSAPKNLMTAAPMNAAGFYESEKITAFNEKLMASLGLSWFDLNAMPDDWLNILGEAAIIEGVAILNAEFGDNRLPIMKDPRLCRLLPFWMRVFERTSRTPVIACIHRAPAEVAGSLETWANYSPEYGELLWMRYVLEAEKHSRGARRSFFAYSELICDWSATIERVTSQLGLDVNISNEGRVRVNAFLSKDLHHISVKSGEPVAQLHNAATVFGNLERLRLDGENSNYHTIFDAQISQLEVVINTVAPVARRALDRFREIRKAREELNSFENMWRETEALHERHNIENRYQLAELEHKANQIADLLHDRQLENNAQITTLEKKTQELIALEQKTQELSELSDALQSRNLVLVAAVSDQTRETSIQRRMREDVAHQLAHARRAPIEVLADLWKYKLLKRLGGRASPLPSSVKMRFMRSALKRHPTRSIHEFQSSQIPAVNVTRAQVADHASSSDCNTSTGQRKQKGWRDLPNVLLVSHDASWTGAPILVYNLSRLYQSRYNVTVLCLNGGPLLSALSDVSASVEVVPYHRMPKNAFDQKIKSIIADGNFAFAVVNSIESRHVLEVMRKERLPTVALLHEFASYTLPRTAFPDAISQADTIVFSTSITLRNAIDLTGIGYSPKVKVLCQGKCEIPNGVASTGGDYDNIERLQQILRPFNDTGEKLVIGAGTVQMRKGTDLFIEVARRVLQLSGGDGYRFVWFGGGYDPEGDPAYSIYLEDQLKRAGIEDRVMLLPVTQALEDVYKMADIFLLSSRLDPLPNVAVDAMRAGLPVICFDRASGIPEILMAAGLRDSCVASYLDTSEMAEKVFRLKGDEYDQVSAQTMRHALENFDFERYGMQIERWGLETRRKFEEHDRASEVIQGSCHFAPDFMRPPLSRGKGRFADAGKYVSKYSLSPFARRPEPGFNQDIYCAFHNSDEMPLGDAYADFLQKGRPDGLWKNSVIQGPVTALTRGKPVAIATALHVHAYYIDGLEDIVSRIKVNVNRPSLFVSVASDLDRAKAEKILSSYDGESEVKAVPNVGRDIAPLLTQFGNALIRDFEVIGHVHCKKSLSIQNSETAERWLEFCLSNVIGGPEAGSMMDAQLSEFQSTPSVGVVFPADPNVLSWSKNKPYAERIVSRMGFENLPDAIDFPVGTMFWIRKVALQPFVDLSLKWSDYPPEPLPYDGTILHALERLFGVVPRLSGLEIRVTNIQGITR